MPKDLHDETDEVDELQVMRRIDNLLKKVPDRPARQRVLNWLAAKWMPEEEYEPATE